MALPREQSQASEEHHSSGLVWFREAFFDQGPPKPADDDGADRLAQSMVKQRLFGESDTTQVGRFVVLDKLGEGGMGVVYSAYDKELDRKVAVKLLRRTDAGEDGHRRMQREAQAMARLSHPNVVQVYEVGFYEGQLFVVMEFVEGQTLRTWCRKKPRTWWEVVRVFVEAGRGLAAAHDAGLVHRDFKPENVLIGDDGRVRVLDFGLARSHEVDDAEPSIPELDPFALAQSSEPHAAASSSAFASRLTRSGTVLGTPAYMSPEQHMRQAADARSDQFSFCVALYEALAGERPFDEDNRAVLAFAKQTGQVREWPRERNKVPKWLRRALHRGLQPHPVERWPSMAALLVELGRIRTRTRRRWYLITMAAVLVASVVGYGAVTSWAARSELCSGSEAEGARMWNAVRQGRVLAAMTQADGEVAQTAWPAVSLGIQAFTDQWVAIHREACEATNVRREQTRTVYNLQLQCLQRRRGQLDTLLAVLADAQTKMVADASDAVASLPPVSDCADLKQLQSSSMRLLPPESAEVKAVAQGLRAELDRVRSLTAGKLFAEARNTLEVVMGEVRELGYRPLLAEAEYERGLLELNAGEDLLAAERALTEALWLAEEVRHDTISARAMAKYLKLVGIDQARREQAMRHVRHAEAILRRSDMQALAHQELLESLSNLLYVDEKTEPSDVSVQEEFERAYTRGKVRSPDEFSVTGSLRSLSEELEREGELEKAVEHYTRALEVARGQTGDQSHDVAQLLARLGSVHAELGDTRAAVSTYQRAERIYRELLDPGDSRRLHIQFRLAEVAMARREYRKAAGYLLRARKRTAQSLLLAEVEILQGELNHRRGRGKRAKRNFEAGLRVLADHSPGTEEAAQAGMWLKIRGLTGQGELRLSGRSPFKAVKPLLAALQQAQEHEKAAPRGLLPRIRFALARARWAEGDDESRFVAVGLARAAAREFSDLRGRYLVELAQVEAWLQARADNAE